MTTTTTLPAPETARREVVAEAVAEACAAVAPTWPLDRFIAVNPFWGFVAEPLAEAAGRIGTLAGTRLTAPRSMLRDEWNAGRLGAEHLQAAIDRTGLRTTLGALLATLLRDEDLVPERLPLVADLCGAAETVTHQISQHAAAFFDAGQSRWHLAADDGLYASWRRQIAADRGLAWAQGRDAVQARIAALPEDPRAAIAEAVRSLGLADAGLAPYLTALLLSVNGWAAWCAHEAWQAKLAGREDTSRLVELLAVRASWERLLAADRRPAALAAWAARWNDADAEAAALAAAQRVEWTLQTALEIAYQQRLMAGLASAPKATPTPVPAVQAVFCIDVRSEVFRRALEAAAPDIATKGFAGFFGLPISYASAGSTMARPQLPGLLAPALEASEPTLAKALVARRRLALQWRQRWADLRGQAASAFSFVEACGLAYGAKLVGACFPGDGAPARWEDTGLPKAARGACPRLDVDAEQGAAIAAQVLGAMGLVRGFAPLVLLAGHGSRSANNPHAAGLDCGACGGQTGEVNARALAELLNRVDVRATLAAGHGIEIPAATRFVPGLHVTTTDDLLLFDTDGVPADALARLQAALQAAGDAARAERAPTLGLDATADAAALAKALRRRANDWSEVRPEWGLADNAAFVAAPRARTRHLKLDGRVFLHDYDAALDADGAVLELIMTAPMVVAHWINFQYHASTLDNRRWGSGDKTLHNVVGGRIGVFEGNGGDLRLGLPMQSLHDGTRWRHTPLRLSVCIEARRAAIDAVVAKHAVVRDLVANGWLHLFAIDAGAVWRWTGERRWEAVADETAAREAAAA